MRVQSDSTVLEYSLRVQFEGTVREYSERVGAEVGQVGAEIHRDV